jgi:hypothetical protein
MRRAAVTRFDVVVIVGLFVLGGAVAAVLLARQRENGMRLQCMNNLRRIGDAVRSYHDTRLPDPVLPPARIAPDYATWAFVIVPHLNAKTKQEDWDDSQSYFAQPSAIRETIEIAYFCPARSRSSWLSVSGDIDPATGEHVPGSVGDYAGVAGTGGPAHRWDGPDADGAIVLAEVEARQGERIVRWRGRTSLPQIEAARGQSNTLLIGEKHVPLGMFGQADAGDASIYDGQNPASATRVAGPGFGLAMSPDAPFNTNFGSFHPEICQFLLADGGVHAFRTDVTDTVLGHLARRSR